MFFTLKNNYLKLRKEQGTNTCTCVEDIQVCVSEIFDIKK